MGTRGTGTLGSGKRPRSLGLIWEKGLGQGWMTQEFAHPVEPASPGPLVNQLIE